MRYPRRQEAWAKSGERQAFWETYGPVDESEATVWRQKIYEARHLGASRLERHRRGKAHGVGDTYAALADVVAALG
ncbi:hypothetical protein [Streptomyces iconiensis]|uniref:Transposase n=1 Tax=Streptomyces iconiensis TaxID=1384038 RepID=A0ABT7A288_9ACTN|nr:hypothetical protein [Streptomyces iconiensis]MDJ1135452.1 hypothetical protein [Streptomyces iconiensis]